MPGGTALFGSSAARGQNKNLVEFKAGKMTMQGKTVHPDKRKGLVYVYQSDDSLMHFCWKDRTTGVVEDDLIIFPEDVEFKKVPQCTTGRVYILKFKSRKLFFWVQEPKTDKDDENCHKVNEVLNNPPSLASQRSGGGTPDSDLQNLLSNMSQQQLMQFFGGVGQIGGLSSLLGTIQSARTGGTTTTTNTSAAVSPPSTGTAAPAVSSVSTPKTPTTPVNNTKPATPQAPSKPPPKSTAGESSNPIQLSQLQNYLSGLVGQQQGVDLSTSLNQESLQAVLNNPELVRELQRHLPSVATDENSQDQLRNTLASPQFQQALSMFSTALQSGQLGPVVSQFGVGSDAVSAANQGNMEEFVRALQAATISCQESSDKDKKEKKEPKKEDDDEMNLD
ncbi:proteasomal ubiquitin receptor ADRM1 [Cimex lectularius]|uniref:Proteasomal ubiquitin receptor ADRM1 homolog n=1 Tax=Cimex lectularius TaxID=79782 RepID=A0A8I6RV48_CIMLE|nr:proteasomal ubiquitin receptor ADRM1 [Cimex lectularius]XP_014252988.1 proteasomal ubiquitin receptor ADRM1 [Cimex lectularius]XP_014252989.1 proteasomal ubiquitin receptor ADRM1 [Cimex lectularius]